MSGQKLLDILREFKDLTFQIYNINACDLFIYINDDPSIERIREVIDKLEISEYCNFEIATRKSYFKDRSLIEDIIHSSDQFSRYDDSRYALLNRSESIELMNSLKDKISKSGDLSGILFFSSKLCKLVKMIKNIDASNSWSNRCIRIIGDRRNLTNFKIVIYTFKSNSINRTKIINGIPITINYKLGILCQRKELIGEKLSP